VNSIVTVSARGVREGAVADAGVEIHISADADSRSVSEVLDCRQFGHSLTALTPSEGEQRY
jgi:hypothetical protein